MARGGRPHHRTARRIRSRPYMLPSSNQTSPKNVFSEKYPKILDKKNWEDVICSVCMECPHNAVLLLCSSHDKGCRPYMCGTSFRYSNCLEQYKKASAKLISSDQEQRRTHTCELKRLTCPLCRGQVKGWTIVEAARHYLNLKKRSCVQENCSFLGTYKELRKHMKADHPCARPREVDPSLEQKWRRLERERDQDDVISTIRSTMPGAMVLGDYVIERNTHVSDSDDDDHHHLNHDHRTAGSAVDAGFDSNLVNVFLLLHAFGPSGNATGQLDESHDLALDENDLAINDPTVGGGLDFSDHENDGFSNYDNEQGSGMSLAIRLRRHGRVLLGRSGRRRRNREANRGSR